MKARKSTFFIVVIAILALAYVAAFGINAIGIKGAQEIRFGIDIRGGVEAVYKAVDYTPNAAELDAAKQIFETRMDYLNITDREVTVDVANSRVIVQFPWKSDETEFDAANAISELGETAHLTFQDMEGNIMVDGKNVVSATAVKNENQSFDNTSKYLVRLVFDEEGAVLFADATGSLTGQQMGIFMDDMVISAPMVNERIEGGEAVITGMATMADAKKLADRINAGALPFIMECSSSNSITPTLGNNALWVMLLATLIAFILVCLFMLFYYRLTGFVACFALFLQVVCQILALSIPQFTLTLSGIAAIILSIGMGVDANIISAERIKEEINAGKTIGGAIDTGFHRAFSAVFDGNMTGALVAIVMMTLGSGDMYSFGYSLLTGMLFNFLAGVWSTRLMTKSLSAFGFLRKPALYGARRVKND